MVETVKVVNVKCGGCAHSIEKGVKSIEGVQEVNVAIETGVITLQVSNVSVINKVKEKLAFMGYPEEGAPNTILKKAASFVSCATGKMASK